MAADEVFRGALRALAEALNEISAPSMIIGGVAVIAAGVPRQTIDIDATVLGRSVTVDNVPQYFNVTGSCRVSPTPANLRVNDRFRH